MKMGYIEFGIPGQQRRDNEAYEEGDPEEIPLLQQEEVSEGSGS
jgi:hypothetical protein